METVITAMEEATGGEVSQDIREQAVSILNGMQSNLQSEIDQLDTEIENIDGRVESAEGNLQGAENRLANAPAGVDRTPYQNAVNNAVATYDSLIARQSELEGQRGDYEDALQRTKYYLTVLGMAEDGVSSYYVGANLRDIQSELFETSPDAEKMQKLAKEVFERLQSAVDLGADNQYQEVLAGMNSFLQNLETYREIKDAGLAIQELTNGLADGSILSLESDEDFKDWGRKFNRLKATISGLPVYILSGISSLDTDSFDRAVSIGNLDQTIRRYLTEHNVAQAGLIYLISPYREVALFSLFLAFLLDIAAFVTGVMIDRVSNNSWEGEEEMDVPVISSSHSLEQAVDYADENIWDTPPELNRYLFLTGVYTFDDGVVSYKAIEHGETIEIKYHDRNVEAGLYLWDEQQLLPVEQSELLFKGASGGPEDGVYIDCILNYDDHMLNMTQSGKSVFLGPVGAKIPVYFLTRDQYDVINSKDISNVHGEKVVIALSREGDRIAAIYIIE